MSRERRKHNPAFKAKVALEVMKGELGRTGFETASDLKKALADGAAAIFDHGNANKGKEQKNNDALGPEYQQIGQLNFLEERSVPSQQSGVAWTIHQTLSIVRQCALLGVGRSSLYYRPKETSQGLSLMREWTASTWKPLSTDPTSLERQGMPVSRKRVQRLRVMGLQAYRQPRPANRRGTPGLWRDLTQPAQPGMGGRHTYLPTRGFLYLVVIMMAQPVRGELSNTLRPPFVPRR